MSGNITVLRQGIILATCLGIALILGYLLANPTDITSVSVIGLVLCALAFPLWLRWHQAALIFAWNASLIVFFLPGQPKLAFVMAFTSLLLAILMKSIHHNRQGVGIRQVAWPLCFMALVVLVTASLTGGIAGRALGAENWGGKRYLGVFAAIMGYFALTAYPIPQKKAFFYSSLFFLSGLTALFSDIAFALGPAFYFLFNFFPAELASSQFFSQDLLMRLQGVSVAALSFCYFLLMRYGISGLFEGHKLWRLLLFIAVAVVSLLGGFRSAIIILGLILAAQCIFEGIYKTRLFAGLLCGAVLCGSIIIGFANKLPLSIQRSLSFLPINLDPAAKLDAQSTWDWRLEMWQVLLPDIPKYFWLGKGFTYSGTDYYLTQQAHLMGAYAAYEDTLVSGNYHHGILTIIIPFGVFGLIGFIWFCIASLKVLYANYRFSSPELKRVNTFLISFFVARLIYYLFLYGQFDLDLILFVGVVGFSIALNRGVRTNSSLSQEMQTKGENNTRDLMPAAVSQ